MNYKILETVRQYNYAKEACKTCLDNPNALVDMHGLAYWASEVERLHGEIKGNL